MLLTADGVGTNAIMRRTGKSKTCVWRWQERFVEEGFDGLLHDKTRPSSIKPLGAEAAERRCQRNGGSSTRRAHALFQMTSYAARARHSANAAERLCL